MTATTKPKPTRESYFAIYWDHARDLPRTALCTFAGFMSEEIALLVRDTWDELFEYQRARLRAALLQFLITHDQVRVETERSRELRGEKVTA